MAQKMRVEIVDDIDGSAAEQTVPFSLDGVHYEIDLSAENAAVLREELAQYIAAGQRVGGRKVRGVAAAASARRPLTPAERDRNQAIRAWARENGFAVSDHGRIAESVIKQYDERDTTQKRPVPRKQAAARKTRGTAKTRGRRQPSSR
ncbi:Lsr2 family protein [Amycolatopsis sp. NPDC004079]|uniref:histone-like nucleoid-structuring protein Lsr2 n=1 Tax=Amycolatopsis sp. NPDC004079 TaxID=3154549 RepID=UPI0033AD5215